jgi:hypothetical protein
MVQALDFAGVQVVASGDDLGPGSKGRKTEIRTEGRKGHKEETGLGPGPSLSVQGILLRMPVLCQGSNLRWPAESRIRNLCDLCALLFKTPSYHSVEL